MWMGQARGRSVGGNVSAVTECPETISHTSAIRVTNLFITINFWGYTNKKMPHTYIYYKR